MGNLHVSLSFPALRVARGNRQRLRGQHDRECRREQHKHGQRSTPGETFARGQRVSLDSDTSVSALVSRTRASASIVDHRARTDVWLASMFETYEAERRAASGARTNCISLTLTCSRAGGV